MERLRTEQASMWKYLLNEAQDLRGRSRVLMRKWLVLDQNRWPEIPTMQNLVKTDFYLLSTESPQETSEQEGKK